MYSFLNYDSHNTHMHRQVVSATKNKSWLQLKFKALVLTHLCKASNKRNQWRLIWLCTAYVNYINSKAPIQMKNGLIQFSVRKA